MKKLGLKLLSVLLSATLLFGAMPVTAMADTPEEVSVEEIAADTETMPCQEQADEELICEETNEEEAEVVEAESEEVEGEELEYPLRSKLDLFALDWKNADDETISHYVGMTEWMEIGRWLSSLSEEDRNHLFSRDTVLIQPTYIEEEDGDVFEMLYHEYATKIYKEHEGEVFAAYPCTTKGYWKTEIIQLDASGAAVKTAVITHSISGIDTSIPTSKRHGVTVTKSISNNWCSVSAGEPDGQKSYKSKDNETYPYVKSNFSFNKPAGYTVSTRYTHTTSIYKLYWYHSGMFGGTMFDSDDGIFLDCRHEYPNNATCNGKSTSSVIPSTYAGKHSICSVANMYVNAGVGTTANATKGNLTQTIVLTPITYNVNYNGNGATSGASAAQNCTYNKVYTTQANGFSREYTVTYNGMGGTPAVASQTAKYNFLGWGLNNTNTKTHATGASFSNLTADKNGIVTMYAIWQPVSVKLPTATRVGYDFVKWNIGSAGSNYTPTSNVTAQAQWTPHTYKVVLNANNGSAQQTINATYDKTFVLPTPEKTGYTFNGWEVKNGSGRYIGTVKNLTAENGVTIELTADWIAKGDVPYTVNRYKQVDENKEIDIEDATTYKPFNLEEGDPYPGTEVFYGTAGAMITIPPESVDGYQTPDIQSVTIAGDGSTVVNFYYRLIKNSTSTSNGNEEGIIIPVERINEIIKQLEDGQPFSIEFNGVTYEITPKEEGTLAIKFGSTTSEKVVVPGVVTVGDNVYQITEIYKEAFKNNTTIKEVELSANIQKIGDSAFAGCSNLENITLGEGLVTIGSYAFSGCKSLKSVQMPKSLQTIESYAFQKCSALKKVTLNTGLLTIGKKAFFTCSSLTSLKIPKTVLKIGEYAFARCSKLKNVTFTPVSQLLTMGKGIFANCTSLTKITMPEKLRNIPAKAFYNCKKLGSIKIGSRVTSIGNSAFEGCRKIKSVLLPEKVQTIGTKAFYKCVSLKKVTIRSKVITSVGSKAFKGCKKGIKFLAPKSKLATYKKLFKGKY